MMITTFDTKNNAFTTKYVDSAAHINKIVTLIEATPTKPKGIAHNTELGKQNFEFIIKNNRLFTPEDLDEEYGYARGSFHCIQK